MVSVVCGADGFQNSVSYSRVLEGGGGGGEGEPTLIYKLGLSDVFQTLPSYPQILPVNFHCTNTSIGFSGNAKTFVIAV